MGLIHIVEAGEHLAGIAAQFGFSNFRTIWDHPENTELKKLRENPNVLFAGDRLFIPDRDLKEEARQTEKRHRFVASIEALELHVKVHDQGFQPIHGDVVLATESDETLMEQQGDVFQAPIRPETKIAVLDFPLPEGGRLRPKIRVQPGRLDPLETLPGQQQRLSNLGYFAGFVKTEATDPKKVDPQFRWAVEEFQRDHMGPKQVDGVLGPLTLKKLKEVYGC